MLVTTPNPTVRLAAQAFQAAAEYVLVALWGTAALFTLLLGHGPHSLERRTSNIIWAVSETDAFLLCGAILFFVFRALHRAGTSVLVLRILGALSAPALAVLIGRRSFFNVVNQSGYYFLGPLIFLAILVLCAGLYGALLLPRQFKSAAVPSLHIHFAVLALFIPYVPLLILHAANPQRPFPSLAAQSTPAPHYGQVIFARWTPGSQPLTVEAFDTHPAAEPTPGFVLFPKPEVHSADINLNEQEAQTLRSTGLTGSIKVTGSAPLSNSGRLIIILSQQISEPFQFATPAENAHVIYLQTANGWRKLPPEAGEAKLSVRMYIPEAQPNATGYELNAENNHTYRNDFQFVWGPLK
jgi:hypothetical protein